MPAFDKTKDKIAITIPRFSLLKHVDGAGIFNRYNEPYIVSVAVDDDGDATPKINFNYMPFPKVAAGATVNMLGDGHMIYGPDNPGSFAAVSVLIMESDRELREVGESLEGIVKSKAVDLGMKAALVANPGAAGTLAIVKELTELVAGQLKNNRDDELFRVEGTFLRDHEVPYHINRSYNVGNDFVNLDMQVIPLKSHNKQGPKPKALTVPAR